MLIGGESRINIKQKTPFRSTEIVNSLERRVLAFTNQMELGATFTNQASFKYF